MKLQILIVDDHEMFREGLKNRLESRLNFDVVAEASNGESAISQAITFKPELIIMDINMPKMNGIEATKTILSNSPNTKIIALSMHSEKGFVTQMLRAGASAYISKQSAFDELERGITAVLAGKKYVSPAIEEMILHDYIEQQTRVQVPIAILSLKEKEILRCIAEGKNTKETALHMNLSPKTVETHRMHIMDKLGIHSVAELTKYALREGLTSLE